MKFILLVLLFLPSVAFAKKHDYRCLAEAVYFESRNQPFEGQLAVAITVLNRVESEHHPNSICKVVNYKKRVRRGNRLKLVCAFSYECDGLPEIIRDKKSWETSLLVASLILDNHAYFTRILKLEKVLFFHADYIVPWWAKYYIKVTTIGNHIFYR